MDWSSILSNCPIFQGRENSLEIYIEDVDEEVPYTNIEIHIEVAEEVSYIDYDLLKEMYMQASHKKLYGVILVVVGRGRHIIPLHETHELTFY